MLVPVPHDHFYILQSKETIWRVAKRYGVTVELLKELNSITDIAKVKIGQKIILPLSTQAIKNPQF